MLAGWTQQFPLPSSISRAWLEDALLDAHAVLVPASEKAFAVLMDRLLEFADTFGVKHPGKAKAVRFYSEALEDLPADLLAKAVDSVVRNYVYGHRLPPPGDLRKAVSDELLDRTATKLRIDSALRFGKFEKPPVEASPEEKERNLKILADAKRALRGNADEREKTDG